MSAAARSARGSMISRVRTIRAAAAARPSEAAVAGTPPAAPARSPAAGGGDGDDDDDDDDDDARIAIPTAASDCSTSRTGRPSTSARSRHHAAPRTPSGQRHLPVGGGAEQVDDVEAQPLDERDAEQQRGEVLLVAAGEPSMNAWARDAANGKRSPRETSG